VPLFLAWTKSTMLMKVPRSFWKEGEQSAALPYAEKTDLLALSDGSTFFDTDVSAQSLPGDEAAFVSSVFVVEVGDDCCVEGEHLCFALRHIDEVLEGGLKTAAGEWSDGGVSDTEAFGSVAANWGGVCLVLIELCGSVCTANDGIVRRMQVSDTHARTPHWELRQAVW